MFPTNEDADKASDKLDSAGFAKEDYSVSRYSTTGNIGDSKNYDYEEDEKTTGFGTGFSAKTNMKRKSTVTQVPKAIWLPFIPTIWSALKKRDL